MSVAAMQYDKFADQLADEERVFTFTNDGELLIYRVHDEDTIPFWSSRNRLETIQDRLVKYRDKTITEYSLSEFYEWLDQLEDENINVGVNWSGEKLVGYNVPVAQLRARLEHRLSTLGKQPPASRPSN